MYRASVRARIDVRPPTRPNAVTFLFHQPNTIHRVLRHAALLLADKCHRLLKTRKHSDGAVTGGDTHPRARAQHRRHLILNSRGSNCYGNRCSCCLVNWRFASGDLCGRKGINYARNFEMTGKFRLSETFFSRICFTFLLSDLRLERRRKANNERVTSAT